MSTAKARRSPSGRATQMPRSAIREIMALAAGNPDVIHLEVGEPDFATPPHIVDAACEALHAGWTRYTSNAGIPPLRDAIAKRVTQRSGRPYDMNSVVVTTGAVGALFTAVMAVADPGDEVLIPDPGWPNYESIVHISGAHPIRYPLAAHDRFLPNIDDIAKLITSRTKAIVINTPANPTGAVFPSELMTGFGALAERHGLFLISDEIYEDIIYDGRHVSAASLGLTDRVFVVSGVSKSYAMTGWRLGYLVCPPDLADIAAKLQEPVTSCASAVAQKAAEAAITGPQDCVADAVRTFTSRRNIVMEMVGDPRLLPVPPAGAFYALIQIDDRYSSALEFAKTLLRDQGVATVPGGTFGRTTDRMIRIAFTTGDEKLRIGLARLRNAIAPGM
jgi:aspartate aminotransferase/aminotransferase